jgi:hypothetical protein
MAINKIRTIAIEDDAVISSKIGANQVGISELAVTDGTPGQVLSTSGSGTLAFSTINSENDYADSLAFSTTTGVFTLGRSGALADLTIDLDGRYTTANDDNYVDGVTFTESTGNLVFSFGGSGTINDITTNILFDSKYHPIDSTATPSPTFKENIQDIVGGMVSSNTETGIAVTYDDSGAVGASKLDFSVVAGATIIPSGTVMVFYQASAPTAWTQITTQNNKALRVVSGTGGGSGGTHDLSAPPSHSHTHTHNLAGTGDATTLTVSQMPSHTHTVWGGSIVTAAGGDNVGVRLHNGTGAPASGSAGSSGSHYHNVSVSGSITASAPTPYAPKYSDVIICSKDA